MSLIMLNIDQKSILIEKIKEKILNFFMKHYISESEMISDLIEIKALIELKNRC